MYVCIYLSVYFCFLPHPLTVQHKMHYLYFKIYLFTRSFRFLAVAGVCCCTWTFSGCGDQGSLFAVVCVLLIAGPSSVSEHRL